MYLVKAYIYNRNCRDKYFYANSWNEVKTIVNGLVDIDEQEKFVKTIRKVKGIITEAKLQCDTFEITASKIENFSEFCEELNC